jgi:PelA/Pel-15E family pectate lyase
MAFLRAYEATGDAEPHLTAAVAAGHCLAWGQLESGGWTYRIDFDLEKNRNRYHHLDPSKTPNYGKLRNTTTFDDDTTQSATRFLMELDRFVDDPIVDNAVRRALECFLRAQYEKGPWAGAWPQRFPPPSSGYGRFPTFNDNTMSDCVRTMRLAYEHYGRGEHLDSVKRCLGFYLRAQLPEPQGAWAQQYDENLKPAWARKFEPPAISGGESSGNMRLLMDMYLDLGDPRYLGAVGRAVAWYRRSRIGGTEARGVWARFYEVDTNRPLYFTRTYKLVYNDDDLPVHYSFQGNYGVNQQIARFEEIRRRGRERIQEEALRASKPEELKKLARKLGPRVRGIIQALDARGRWVKVVAKREQVRDAKGRVGYQVDPSTRLSMLYSKDFTANMEILAEFVMATQGGPAIKAPARRREKKEKT